MQEGDTKKTNTKCINEANWEVNKITGQIIPLLEIIEDSTVENMEQDTPKVTTQATNPTIPQAEISNEELENAKILASKVDNLNLNPITKGNAEMGIEPMVIKEEIPEQMEEEETPGYNPEGDQEHQTPPRLENQLYTMENYEPSPIAPVEITPVSSDTPTNPVDPLGLQIKRETLETEQDPEAIAASCFYGNEEDLDDKITKALANKAESKRIADEKLNLIITSKKIDGKRSSRNPSTASNASNSSQIASSSITLYANEDSMDTSDANEPNQQPAAPLANDESSDKDDENRKEDKPRRRSGHSSHKKKRKNNKDQ